MSSDEEYESGDFQEEFDDEEFEDDHQNGEGDGEDEEIANENNGEDDGEDDDGDIDYQPVQYEPSRMDALPWRKSKYDFGSAGLADNGFMELEEIAGGSYEIVKLPGGGTVIKIKGEGDKPVASESSSTKEAKKEAADTTKAGDKKEKEKAQQKEAPKSEKKSDAAAKGKDDAKSESKKRKRGAEEEEEVCSEDALDAKPPAVLSAVATVPGKKAATAPHAKVAPSHRPCLPVDTVAQEWGIYNLHPLLLAGIARLGFAAPTPIQRQALPSALVQYKDVIGAAETGSGKTLAYGLPILQRLLERRERLGMDAPSSSSSSSSDAAAASATAGKRTSAFRYLPALVLTPTRELAMQVADHLSALTSGTPLRVAAIVGGLSHEKQARLLRGRPDVIVATPGRLWDLASRGAPAPASAAAAAAAGKKKKNSSGDGSSSGGGGGMVDAGATEFLSCLSCLQFLVLDEADRLCEKGHYDALTSILAAVQAPPPPPTAGGADDDDYDEDADFSNALDPVAEKILRDKAKRERQAAAAKAAAATAATDDADDDEEEQSDADGDDDAASDGASSADMEEFLDEAEHKYARSGSGKSGKGSKEKGGDVRSDDDDDDDEESDDDDEDDIDLSRPIPASPAAAAAAVAAVKGGQDKKARLAALTRGGISGREFFGGADGNEEDSDDDDASDDDEEEEPSGSGSSSSSSSSSSAAAGAGQSKRASKGKWKRRKEKKRKSGTTQQASSSSASGSSRSSSLRVVDVPSHYRRQTFLFSATLGLSTAQTAKDAAAALLAAKAAQHAATAAAVNTGAGGANLPSKLSKKAMRRALAAARQLSPVEALMARVGLLGKPAVIKIERAGAGAAAAVQAAGGDGDDDGENEEDQDEEKGHDIASAIPSSVALPPGLRLCRMSCEGGGDKDVRLYHFLLRYPGRALVFVNSIATLKRVAALLTALRLPVHTLHASMQQRQRLKHLERYRADVRGVLVATDVAARGLDIPDVAHVLHYSLPQSTEVFVHRCGRTARAQSAGLAAALVAPEDQRAYTRILTVLGLAATGLPEFPADDLDRYIRRLTSRISTARKICEAEAALNRTSASQHKLLTMARAAGLEVDDATAVEEGLVGGQRSRAEDEEEEEEGGGSGSSKKKGKKRQRREAEDDDDGAAESEDDGGEAAAEAAFASKQRLRALKGLRKELDALLAQPLAPVGMSHRYVATVNPHMLTSSSNIASSSHMHPLQSRVAVEAVHSSSLAAVAAPVAQRSGSALVAPRVTIAAHELDGPSSAGGGGKKSKSGGASGSGGSKTGQFGGIIPVGQLKAGGGNGSSYGSASSGAAGNEAMAVLAAKGRVTAMSVPVLAKAALAKAKKEKKRDKNRGRKEVRDGGGFGGGKGKGRM